MREGMVGLLLSSSNDERDETSDELKVDASTSNATGMENMSDKQTKLIIFIELILFDFSLRFLGTFRHQSS